jgi:hypothetical protein
MIEFTGYQYLLIDAANQFGHDKMNFEDRIEWAQAHVDVLETLTPDADNKPLFVKVTQAIRKAQAGQATGHLVGFDAVCSGIQVMSVLTGCKAGAEATGMVNPLVRADAYTKATEYMNDILNSAISIPRKDIKQAIMTSFYGSKAEPIKLFGEDTPEIDAFYEAAYKLAPGPWELLQDLIGSWQPMALKHAWKLPDGFDAVVKVMTTAEEPLRIEVDELDHASFSYVFYENTGKEKGLSNAANVVHSVDGYVLRSIQRRCNYDVDMVAEAAMCLEIEVMRRLTGGKEENLDGDFGKFGYYVTQYMRSGMPDAVIFPYLTVQNVQALDAVHLNELHTIVTTMLTYKPFAVVTIHDEFKCHANNMNYLRKAYVEIMANIAESNLLSDLMEQVTGQPYIFKKKCVNLGVLIRKSNYALS